MTPPPVEHQGRVIRASIRVGAPPEILWEAWTSPSRLSGWFTDRMFGEAVDGGTVTWVFDRFASRFPYEVVAARRPSLYVLRGRPVGRPPFVLEIGIEPVDGGSEVTIANSGFSTRAAEDEEHEGVDSGWRMALAILKEYVERHFGEPKQVFFAMQPARFEYAQARARFTEESGLAQWLTTSGRIPPEAGADYATVLWGGAPMTGRVLAATPREVAVTWSEIRGVVELKAFRLGPGTRAVCVRGCGWSLAEERAEAIEQMMVAAVDRLVAALTGAGRVV